MLDDQAVKMIRDEAVRAEHSGHLTPSQLKLIYARKWFHLLVPEVYGGKEVDLPTFVRFMEYLAGINGSLAWCVNLGAGANMFSGYMEPKVADALFRNPQTCIAGSGAQSGIARSEGEHYIINGSWKYASGAHHATHFSFNAKVDDKQSPAFLSFIIPREQVHVLNTWHTTGLMATSSHDFFINKGIIPIDYAFDLTKETQHNHGSLYRFPFQMLAEINILAVSVGLARRFTELAKEVRAAKVSEHTSYEKFNSVSNQLEEQFIVVNTNMHRYLHRLWDENKQGILDEKKDGALFTDHIIQSADAARALVDGLYPYLGMQSIVSDHEINRVWRDFKTASQHALLSPDRISV